MSRVAHAVRFGGWLPRFSGHKHQRTNTPASSLGRDSAASAQTAISIGSDGDSAAHNQDFLAAITALRLELDDLRTQQATDREAAEASAAKIAAMEQTIADLKQTIEGLQRDKETLQQDNAALQTKLEQAVAAKAALEQQTAALQQQLEEAEIANRKARGSSLMVWGPKPGTPAGDVAAALIKAVPGLQEKDMLVVPLQVKTQPQQATRGGFKVTFASQEMRRQVMSQQRSIHKGWNVEIDLTQQQQQQRKEQQPLLAACRAAGGYTIWKGATLLAEGVPAAEWLQQHQGAEQPHGQTANAAAGGTRQRPAGGRGGGRRGGGHGGGRGSGGRGGAGGQAQQQAAAPAGAAAAGPVPPAAPAPGAAEAPGPAAAPQEAAAA
jgi:hypothetical protein